MNNHDSEKCEQQPFISKGDEGCSIPVPVKKKKRRPCCYYLCVALLIIFIVLLLLLLLFYLYFLIVVWPDPCFLLVSDPSEPIHVGLNVQNSQVFVIFNRPMTPGVLNGSLHLCGKPAPLDTTLFPMFDSINVKSATFKLRNQECTNQPPGTDLHYGTLRIGVVDGYDQTVVATDTINIAFSTSDGDNDSKTEPFAVTLTEDGISPTEGAPQKRISLDFRNNTIITINPRIGVFYSDFMLVSTSEIVMYPSESKRNKCNRPAVGVTFETTFMHKFCQAFIHWVKYSFPPISDVGLAAYPMLDSIEIGEVSVGTKPVFLETETKQQQTESSNESVPFQVERGALTIEQTGFSLSHLTLNMTKEKTNEEDESGSPRALAVKSKNSTVGDDNEADDDDEGEDKLGVLTSSKLFFNFTDAKFDVAANLKKERKEMNLSFEQAVFDLGFVFDISHDGNNNNETNDTDADVELKKKLWEEEIGLGSFFFKNLSINSPETGHVFTPSLSANVDPIHVQMLTQTVPSPSQASCSLVQQKMMSLKFAISNMSVANNESLKLTALSQDKKAAPITVNLYRIGRIANGISFLLSSVCVDSSNTDFLPHAEKITSQRQVRKANDEIKSVATVGPKQDGAGSPKMQVWSLYAADVDARVFGFPAFDFLQIAELGVKLNTSDGKANFGKVNIAWKNTEITNV